MPVSEKCRTIPLCRRRCPQFRDAVVIGNGPSAITLSFMLAGHWPHYNGNRVADPCLQVRLEDTKDYTLIESNLEELSEGLSGRSRNPISVLYDAMARPDADLGLNNPSAVDWTYCHNRAVSHVVIGRGKPGGTWHAMDGNVLTLSFGTWMELPDSDFSAYCGEVLGAGRPTVSTVAKYYESFVEEKELSPYFLNHSVVTSVRRISLNCNLSSFNRLLLEDCIHLQDRCNLSRRRSSSARRERAVGSDSASSSGVPAMSSALDSRRRSISVSNAMMANNDDRSSFYNSNPPESSAPPFLWEVRGYRQEVTRTPEHSDEESPPSVAETAAIAQRIPFHFVTPNLVLATGTSDSANRLGVYGEDLPFVTHSLAGVEDLLSDAPLRLGGGPLVVIGAGLTAADAVVAALAAGVDVYHVFRRDPLDPRVIFNNLPAGLYPEYHRVHALMTKRRVESGYRSLPKCKVVAIRPSRHILLECENGCGKFKVGAVAALIGSRPNLDFMGRLKNQLGVVPGALLDSKVNIFDGDVFTHESNAFPGLFALGPLAGDNFVRFLQGGALAVAAAINRKVNDGEPYPDSC